MSELLSQFLPAFDVTEWLRLGGLALIFFIIFAETAVVLGVLVPGGDSLLITVGLLCSSKILPFDLPIVILTMLLAAISGDILGYYLGRSLGNKLLQKEKTWLLKRRHLEKALLFYEQNNSLTFIAGRFLPVIRTFNPMLSGTSGMPFLRFLFYSSLSATIWILSLVLTSYYAGNTFPQLVVYLHLIVPGLLLLSAIPVAAHYLVPRLPLLRR